jgi:DNA processing protein
MTVVSGLALGVDAAGHLGALDVGGDTVAVLGCGPDVAYPRTNAGLYRRILESGLILSEYAPGTPPAPWRFPARKGRPFAAMRFSLNHASRARRSCPRMA